MTLGENITALRMKRGLTQGELADALEISRQSVSKWETDASVPELDKLLRLAELFQVTLDELVKGELPQSETAEASAEPTGERTAEPPRFAREERHTQRVIGTILLCFGVFIAALFLLLGGGLAGLLFGAPFLLCGAICLTVRRRTGLWCGWAAYLLVIGYLQYATGLSWLTILQTFRWTAEMNYVRLAVAWGMALFLFVMLAATLRSYRLLTIPCGRKQVGLLVLGWLAAFAANWLENRWLVAYLAQYQSLPAHSWVFTLNDIFGLLFNLVVIALLVFTAAIYRAWRENRKTL